MLDRMRPLALALTLLASFGGWGALRAQDQNREAVEKLVAKFGSAVFEERSQAYQKLVLTGPAALPPLREAMKSEDLEVARRASNCAAEIERVWHREYLEKEQKELGRKELSLSEVLRLSKDNSPYVRHSAAYLLYKWHEEPEALAAFLRLIRDEHVLVRRAAANAGRCFVYHKPHEEAVQAFIAALKDEDEGDSKGDSSVSAYAASSLGDLKQPAQEVISALIKATNAPADGLRYSALRAVGRLAARDRNFAPQAVEALRTALGGKDYVKELFDFGLRCAAAGSLGLLKAEAKSAIPDLIEALRAEGAPDAYTASMVRLSVMYALGDIGSDATTAVPHLVEIARSKKFSQQEREGAVAALKRIDPEVKLPTLPD